jgi:predicted DNA-binding protein (UPF0251 family)
MGRCVVEKTKKKADMKMVTVDQYMEEKQLNEMEFRQQVFSRKIQIAAWVTNLPIIHFWPYAHYQVKNKDLIPWDNNTGYLYLFRSRKYALASSDLAQGLMGLSKDITMSILDNGAVELSENSLRMEICFTKHAVILKGISKHREGVISLRGTLPPGIYSSTIEKRDGKLADYPSDLFEDHVLKIVVADIIPDFDFRAWRFDDSYRKSKLEHVKSTFETVIEEHKYKIGSLIEKCTYVPEKFQEGKLLSEVKSLPDGDYRIEAEDFKALKLSRRGDTFKPNQFRLEVKVPPPVISRSQLIVFDINEDMYSPGGEVEDIVLQDELAPEELENELDYQSDLYTNEKRLLVLKGWLGANKEEASKDLDITRENLWNELSEIDDKIFPPASNGTIKGFFKFQDLCKFKRGRRPGK